MEWIVPSMLVAIVLIHFIFWSPKIESDKVSHFPVLIQLEDGSVLVCERPEDLPTGRGFRVVATNREIVI